jgi:hypothetical protein
VIGIETLPASSAAEGPLDIDPAAMSAAFAAAFTDLSKRRGRPSGSIAIDPETVEGDLARLVLTLVEFLRRLLEMQAIRRMEAGTLSPDEEERLGLTFMRARGKVLELARSFGLSERDLSLDLGPLGRLM